ncbi:hypothetical protein B0H19DRAFT_1265335 [Mycena capillaripes]|nr:hypothetical protein B0H19DRAFT_1265335 [Mycena capillaripes]
MLCATAYGGAGCVCASWCTITTVPRRYELCSRTMRTDAPSDACTGMEWRSGECATPQLPPSALLFLCLWSLRTDAASGIGQRDWPEQIERFCPRPPTALRPHLLRVSMMWSGRTTHPISFV